MLKINFEGLFNSLIKINLAESLRLEAEEQENEAFLLARVNHCFVIKHPEKYVERFLGNTSTFHGFHANV